MATLNQDSFIKNKPYLLVKFKSFNTMENILGSHWNHFSQGGGIKMLSVFPPIFCIFNWNIEEWQLSIVCRVLEI